MDWQELKTSRERIPQPDAVVIIMIGITGTGPCSVLEKRKRMIILQTSLLREKSGSQTVT